MPFGGPLNPPNKKIEIAPRTKSDGVSNEILPCQIVATQLKNFTPVGTATSRVLYMKGRRPCLR